MRDLMKIGDQVLFYHSSCPEPGIAGLAKVASGAYPDETQFDKKGKYFDPKASRENPRWMLVDVKLGKGVFVPYGDEAEYGGSGDACRGLGQHDLEEGLHPCVTIDKGGALIFLWESRR